MTDESTFVGVTVPGTWKAYNPFDPTNPDVRDSVYLSAELQPDGRLRVDVVLVTAYLSSHATGFRSGGVSTGRDRLTRGTPYSPPSPQGGWVRISTYDGAALARGDQARLIADFFLFEPALRNGCCVAVGDVDRNGLGDLIGGAGPGGGPRVLVTDGQTTLRQRPAAAIANPLTNFFADDPDNCDGVPVAAKNLNGDRNADVVAGTGEGGGTTVAARSGANLLNGSLDPLLQFGALPGSLAGVFVG